MAQVPPLERVHWMPGLGRGFHALNFAIALVVRAQQVTDGCSKYVLDGDTYE